VVAVVLYLVVSVLDLVAVARYGLWQGLANRQPAKAVTRTVLYVLLLPMAAGVLCTVGVGWPLIGIVKNLVFANYAQEQLRRYFRSLLTERYGWSEEPEHIGQPTKRALAHQLPRVLPP